MNLPALELRVAALAAEPVELAQIAGSALRGDFGASFRAVTCTTLAPTCKGCHLLAQCAFPTFFNSPAWRPDGVFPKQIDTPRRYAFDIANGGRTIAPNETFEFGLRIVGEIRQYLPWVALAILEMGRRGLGKGRGRFSVQAIFAGKERTQIVNGGTIQHGTFTAVSTDDLFAGIYEASESPETRPLEIRFVHPTYLRAKQHHPFAAPPFSIVARAALRKLSSLATLFGNVPLVLPFVQMIAEAEQVKLVSANITTVRETRYSSRQYRRFPLEGIAGSVRYVDAPAWAFPVLSRAGWIGIGKMTTHGLGRIEVAEWVSSSS